jgi:hypothetical protein
MNSLVLVAFLVGSVFFLLCQWPAFWRRFPRHTHFLPSFRLFAPKPLSWDVVIFFRASPPTQGSDWHVFGVFDPPLRAIIWHPERRVGKAMVDLCRQFLHLAPQFSGPDDPRFFRNLKAWLTDNRDFVGSGNLEIAVYLLRRSIIASPAFSRPFVPVCRFVTLSEGGTTDR